MDSEGFEDDDASALIIGRSRFSARSGHSSCIISDGHGVAGHRHARVLHSAVKARKIFSVARRTRLHNENGTRRHRKHRCPESSEIKPDCDIISATRRRISDTSTSVVFEGAEVDSTVALPLAGGSCGTAWAALGCGIFAMSGTHPDEHGSSFTAGAAGSPCSIAHDDARSK